MTKQDVWWWWDTCVLHGEDHVGLGLMYGMLYRRISSHMP